MTSQNNYARRFLRVLEVMTKLSRHRLPDDVVGELHLNQIRALHLIQMQPGLAQKELAALLEVTPASISTAIRGMEAVDLVERRADPTDARSMQLFLSRRGQALLDEVQQMRHDAIADLLGALSLDEQRMIVETLERALAARQERNMNGVRIDHQS